MAAIILAIHGGLDLLRSRCNGRRVGHSEIHAAASTDIVKALCGFRVGVHLQGAIDILVVLGLGEIDGPDSILAQEQVGGVAAAEVEVSELSE